MSHLERTVKERFWKKVDKRGPGGCWNWEASQVGKGYGGFFFREKGQRAHRVSWILAFGEIPDGLKVLHHCDNRLCVNPRHLFLGTDADNARDRTEKGRTPHGENHYRSILTADAVREIRQSRATKANLATRYGVSADAIARVQRRFNWKHLP